MKATSIAADRWRKAIIADAVAPHENAQGTHPPRKTPPPHLIDPQLLYPAGCSKERAVKVNGGLHWLCENHRDHQKALQRERYRRIAKEKKAKKHDKEPMPTGPTKSIQSLGGIPETLRSREKGQVAGRRLGKKKKQRNPSKRASPVFFSQHRPCALLERLRRNFIQYFLLALLKLLQHNLAQHTLSRTYEVHFTMDNVILLCKSN
ncbi:hypothetical protein PC117_g13994 [Phytophthora cactorum]|uniref:Uncharacterized protein n=1 Tax=Phytophthora cactorum TaxID=29920 RepID=A0A8T1CZF9_9STRA|nr:hypothetical protein PC117_g13994 [Phytophthora cactorum]